MLNNKVVVVKDKGVLTVISPHHSAYCKLKVITTITFNYSIARLKIRLNNLEANPCVFNERKKVYRTMIHPK